jgi:hypothetical protein
VLIFPFLGQSGTGIGATCLLIHFEATVLQTSTALGCLLLLSVFAEFTLQRIITVGKIFRLHSETFLLTVI